ncbi:MAG TPA: ACT domain-containing protein, partial [Acidimicrobiales bacterium]|nr:ACT domain-containing protein [Acidimicrobiales bacterium]
AGTLTQRGQPRLVMVDDHLVEVPPAEHMLVIRNDDRTGMIGVVGTLLAEAEVNIANMAVGRATGADTALMVLATDHPVPDEVLTRLSGTPGILAAHRVG